MQQEYDYDLFVIGGGSGGLSCGRTAAKIGVKVAIADYVKPSYIGTKWGLGGTCVNVGCIPKKLMHYAGLIGELKEDQIAAGWEIDPEAKHNWKTMVNKVQASIKKRNFEYKGALVSENVKYYNKLATLINQNTIELKGSDNKTERVTANFIVIAVGGRPTIPENLKHQSANVITSDDIFSLKTSPGKTLVVGASYVALECAGFLAALGLDTTVMVRSILLRGFDQQIAEKIGKYMEENKVNFIKGAIPTSVEKMEDGKRKVIYQSVSDAKKTGSDIYDTVLIATGRYSDTNNIGLENVGVKLNNSGKVITDSDERSNIKNIFAIGDCAENRPELTPTAIMGGKFLASRLFEGSKIRMDYTYVATTVFTPIEYGCCGYSEEDAIKKFGAENIDAFHTHFKPLEWNFSDERLDNSCYIKLIVNKKENERVVGFHFLGPHAGEVTQGYAVALKMGATKQHFDTTVGIHPTVSEEILTLTKTRAEDPNATKTGC